MSYQSLLDLWHKYRQHVPVLLIFILITALVIGILKFIFGGWALPIVVGAIMAAIVMFASASR